MRNQDLLTRTSKFLSKVLRHEPELLGLTLQPGGWVPVDGLLEAMRARGREISRETLEWVVRENDKKRFSFDETGTRIRANQGHSASVDLQLTAQTPPDVLHHGTHSAALPIIREEGLRKMARHAVHLSPTLETATRVGMRRGKPIVLHVDARRMAADGHLFYQSDNGVWLTEQVPATYLSEP